MARFNAHSHDARRWGISWVTLLGGIALAGCVGSLTGEDDAAPASVTDDPTTTPNTSSAADVVSSSALRRLSIRELENTLQSVVGFVPAAIERIPPDSLGHSFDRVVNGQTVSPAHLEAFSAIATEVSSTLIGSRTLDDVVSGCPDESIPSLVETKTQTVKGAALSLSPDWSLVAPSNPDWAGTLYAPDVEAVHSATFETPGTYTLTYAFDANGTIDTATVLLDGQPVGTQSGLGGAATLTVNVEIAEAGSHVLLLLLETEPNDNSLAVTFQSLSIEGPLAEGPVASDEQVKDCADSIVEELAPKAWRRPLSDEESGRLTAHYDAIAEEFGSKEALGTLLELIFASPRFLFLVEIGEAVPESEELYRLDHFETASRLSYAICEQPMDDELWAAAAASELGTAEEIDAQARRLFASPCAQVTVQRFFEQWLWLNELRTLTKSADVFPAWSENVRDGMLEESHEFIDGLVWSEEGQLQTLFDADYSFPNEDTAALYGMSGASGKVSLPKERRGILTSPGLLAVTGAFDGTSPVKRGVYILEQILCVDLPAPPSTIAIVPPPPNPDLTTGELWAAHSADPTCKTCHQMIDPVGFPFEEFDGMGKHRTEENGHPIDATGGVPELGAEDGSLVGGAAVAEVIATSGQVQSCAATQWLRFVLGRLDVPADYETIEAVSGAFDETSMREAFVSIVTSEAFLHRTEEKE